MPQLNEQQLRYIKKYQPKRLTACGDPSRDLYQTIHGAHTIEHAMVIDEMHKSYRKMLLNAEYGPISRYLPTCSTEMEQRNEQLIDSAGMGMFGD